MIQNSHKIELFLQYSLLIYLYIIYIYNRVVDSIRIMVLILDGNSLRGANIRRNLYYLTCFRHLIRSTAVTNRILLSEKKLFFFHECVTYYELQSSISNHYPNFEKRQIRIWSEHHESKYLEKKTFLL